jgi:hypothetical protein
MESDRDMQQMHCAALKQSGISILIIEANPRGYV